ncbi:ribosome maturation factor RimM [Luteimonas sp. A277]
MNDSERRILLGRVVGAFGVRGELKFESHTEPLAQVLRYQPWILRDAQGVERELSGVRGRETAKGLVIRIPGVEDRDAAQALRDSEVHVPRSALPPPSEDEFYWVDLEGMAVETVDGVALGMVSHLFATGANDVVVVRDGADGRERMIPFVRPDFITSIDMDARRMVVDWDPDF